MVKLTQIKLEWIKAIWQNLMKTKGKNEKKEILKCSLLMNQGPELILNDFRGGIFPIIESQGKGL